MEKILVEIFTNARLYSVIHFNGYTLGCVRTKSNHQCKLCHFKVMSKNCPKVHKTPACFASVRDDGESVYYPQIKLN